MTTETPELDKMHEVREQSQPIGEFIDWLAGQGVQLVRWAPVVKERWPWKSRYDANGEKARVFLIADHGPDDGVHGPPEEYADEADIEAFPWHESTERMLARFFEIDLNAVEEERRALLDELRELNAS